MSERTFLIQRYCSGNWPRVRGEAPFLVSGPSFSRWAIKGSLAKYGEYRFLPQLRDSFVSAFASTEDPLYYTAWALLEEGIVQAVWASHSPVPDEMRPDVALRALIGEIPVTEDLGDGLIDYLSGIPGVETHRSYLSDDNIELVTMKFP